MEAPGRVELPTRSLGNLGSDALPRNLSDLGWCPTMLSDAMLRHSTVFGHQFGHPYSVAPKPRLSVTTSNRVNPARAFMSDTPCASAPSARVIALRGTVQLAPVITATILSSLLKS